MSTPETVTLVGLSGSGKSTCGRALADHLGRPFVDLDAHIERRTGSSAGELIEQHGESHFRRIESEAVAEACAVPGAVISTGGGAVVDPLNRWLLWQAGRVCWLDAPNEVLFDRLVGDSVDRPLLHGDAMSALAALREARTPFYRAADDHIDASGLVKRTVTLLERVTRAPMPTARRLFDAEIIRDHPMGPPLARVLLGTDLDRPTLAEPIEQASSGQPVVVVDRRAAAALDDLMDALPHERRILIRAGERQKRLRSLEALLEQASAMGAERGDAWIAVGGGTTTDMVGAAAALYLRGAPFVAVPTTWLGMSDAAIGGKVAVDLCAAKNAAGAFWPPVAMLGDVATLRTLPRPRRLDGMAECLKAGLIGDPELWHLVETRGRQALAGDERARYACVERSVRLKLGVVARDPFENGERRQLNLGHTIGHALEVESRYRLAHGQAVVLGLRAVAGIAAHRGADRDLPERIDALASSLGYRLRRDFDARAVRSALGSDKKRFRGRQRWILPMSVGRVDEVDDVTEAELDSALARIAASTGPRGIAP